jgi:hypothetical protein
MIKRPNLRIHGVEEGTKIKTEGIENVFSEDWGVEGDEAWLKW